MAIVHFQLFADCSYKGIVERPVQCAQSPMYLVDYAAPSGSSRLYSTMNLGRKS